VNWFKRKFKPSIAAAATAGAGSTVVTSGTLREFVYLDEVSVYSLTSSPDAPPPVSMSEAAKSTSGEVLNTHLEVGAPGLAKSGVAAELNSGRSTGLEMQRQFNIQSQFARLHRLYGRSFALTASAETTDTKSSENLTDALKALQAGRRAVKADELTRGTLTELRVALRAHSMFDVAVFVKAAGGLIDRHPELLQVPDLQAIRQMKEAGEFLSELMEDLVPIEGLSTTYQLVTDPDGEAWVADIRALRRTFTGTVASSPLRVVGVAEHESFWKDTRRILHSDAEFDILGRISRPGLQADWSPVKLTDAIDRVAPGVGRSINEGLNTLKQIATPTSGNVDASTALVVAAMKFLEELAAHHGVESPTLPDETMSSLLTFSGGLEGQLTALNRVTENFYSQFERLERDAEVVASIRQDAWRSVQVLTDLPGLTADAPAEPEPLALELEFIAMYW
jgi:hypothetical protein